MIHYLQEWVEPIRCFGQEPLEPTGARHAAWWLAPDGIEKDKQLTRKLYKLKIIRDALHCRLISALLAHARVHGERVLGRAPSDDLHLD